MLYDTRHNIRISGCQDDFGRSAVVGEAVSPRAELAKDYGATWESPTTVSNDERNPHLVAHRDRLGLSDLRRQSQEVSSIALRKQRGVPLRRADGSRNRNEAPVCEIARKGGVSLRDWNVHPRFLDLEDLNHPGEPVASTGLDGRLWRHLMTGYGAETPRA